MIRYETERLILRNYAEIDVDDYFAYMRLDVVALHEDFAPYSFAQCKEAVDARLNDDTFLVAQLKTDGRVIGDVCYRPGAYGTYEIAYDFNPAYGKRGYATEACTKLIEHLFGFLEARRLYVGCNEGNEASWRLLERLGFRREAHCIEDVWFKRDAAGNPIYVNSYFYAMLHQEWIAR